METTRGRIAFLAFAAAMAGFLFGYDTAVINGGEQQIQQLCHILIEVSAAKRRHI